MGIHDDKLHLNWFGIRLSLRIDKIRVCSISSRVSVTNRVRKDTVS